MLNGAFAQDKKCVAVYDSIIQKEVYLLPEENAEYPNGGTSRLLSYLSTNLNLPKDCFGYTKIYFNLVVNENGIAAFSKLIKPANDAFIITELTRIINQMPIWKPAKCNGKNVYQKLSLPINIHLK